MKEAINHQNERQNAENGILKKVREILSQAKVEKGIDWNETEDDFVIKNNDRETHVPKWKDIPLGESGGEESIIKIIEAFLENPSAGEKGKLKETIDKQK